MKRIHGTLRAAGLLLLATLATLFAAAGASAGWQADWGARYGDETSGSYSYQAIRAVDTDRDGNIYIAGDFRGYLDLGGATFAADPNHYDIFVAKFTPDGTHLWSYAGGGTGNDLVYDIDVPPSGGVAVVGFTDSPVFTMSGQSDSTHGQSDAYLAVFGSNGTHSFNKVWGGPFQDFAHGVAWRPGNLSIVVSGTYRGTVDFGVGGPQASKGLADFFLTETKVWGAMDGVAVAGGEGNEQWTSVCIDDNDDILFAGIFQNSIDFGNGTLTSHGGSDDGALVKFSSLGSAPVWSENFGGGSSGDRCLFYSVASDGSNIFVTGAAQGTIDLGTGSMTSSGGSDLCVAGYKSDGSPVFSFLGGGTDSDFGTHIDTYEGQLVVSGGFRGTTVFGSQAFPSNGDYDALLLLCDQEGQIDFVSTAGSPYYDGGTQAAVDSNGICFVGEFADTIDFGGGVQLANHADDSSDGFLVRFSDNPLVAVAEGSPFAAAGLRLGPPTPNPARNGTAIAYAAGSGSPVPDAAVYDVAGRLVRVLRPAGTAQAGTFRWDGRNERGTAASPGVYFVRVSGERGASTRRVTVVR